MGRWVEGLIMAAVIIGAGVVHGHNMFNFPYYENDEGVYVAQAWAAGNLSGVRLRPASSKYASGQ